MDLLPPRNEPATAPQLAAEPAALGLYDEDNALAEHLMEAAWPGGDGLYQTRLANALLGTVQAEAMLAETAARSSEDLAAAHHRQLTVAGVADDVGKLAGFLCWQALRVAGPLKLVAQDPAMGPIRLAAAHAAEGLQKLLGVASPGQVPDAEAVKEGVAEMRAARRCLIEAIGILLEMLSGLPAFPDKD
ncbi:DUF6245 family protein [Streptosporangium sandarakinum]|uniref:DUF6245 family protein n=1 Tax=Streptosporangium sandarakinum TaxID=1260955 RepID=UPI0036AAD00C